MFTSLLKNMIKDTDEQRDEKIHRVRSWSVLNIGAGVSHLLVWKVSPTWKLFEPPTNGIFMEFSYVGTINY